MKMLSFSYQRRNQMKAMFSRFPESVVTFRMIRSYYFVYTIRWSENDPIVVKEDLIEMEWLLNKELGLENEYLNRKRVSF